jgi:hypothetical protein
MVNDALVVFALPVLFAGAGLLRSTIKELYYYQSLGGYERGPAASRFLGALEMFWITIYCVKFSYISSFKFHKPLYASVSPSLTRYYWCSTAVCAAILPFTLVGQVLVCPGLEHCTYMGRTSRVFLEMFLTGLDIITDILVISIPAILIQMTQMTRHQTAMHAGFKCLSVFMIAVGITRLVLQYNSHTRRIDHIWAAFLLFIEAAVALIMASITSWRKVFFDNARPARKPFKQANFDYPAQLQLIDMEGSQSYLHTSHAQIKDAVH